MMYSDVLIGAVRTSVRRADPCPLKPGAISGYSPTPKLVLVGKRGRKEKGKRKEKKRKRKGEKEKEEEKEKGAI